MAILGAALSAAGALGGLIAVLGYRLGLMPIRVALLTVLMYAAYTAAAGAVVSLLSMVGLLVAKKKAGGMGLAVAGLVIGAVVFAIPGRMRWEAQRNGYPSIHDITTDTADPPQFVDVLPLRRDAANPPDYDPKIGEQQKGAYPDLAPVRLDQPPERAFEQALKAVNRMGWELVAADATSGRIEATDTTFWFGFKDDVVVRLRPAGGGTVVDVRSKSRVGRGDSGTNARRIRAYVEALRES